MNKVGEQIEITKLIKTLSGLISIKSNYNLKENYTEYLTNKYK